MPQMRRLHGGSRRDGVMGLRQTGRQRESDFMMMNVNLKEFLRRCEDRP